MAVIETQLDNQSEQFNSNAAVMASSTQQFRDIEKRVIDAAEAKAPRYLKKGLLPPRERLSQLLDAGAPFLEMSTLCGYMQEDDSDGSAAGGGCISGIGFISGTRCMVWSMITSPRAVAYRNSAAANASG
jgi:geranyl-CoA carboxylase beta subunit